MSSACGGNIMHWEVMQLDQNTKILEEIEIHKAKGIIVAKESNTTWTFYG